MSVSIKRMTKEIFQISVSLRSISRDIRWYGRKVHRLREKIKYGDQRKKEALADTYQKNFRRLQAAVKRYTDCLNIIHSRLKDFHEAFKK